MNQLIVVMDAPSVLSVRNMRARGDGSLNYTYSRTALYQELDELCRLVDKFKHRGLLCVS